MDSQSPPTHGDAQLTAIGTEAAVHSLPTPSLASSAMEERMTRHEEVTRRQMEELSQSMRMVAIALARLGGTHTGTTGDLVVRRRVFAMEKAEHGAERSQADAAIPHTGRAQPVFIEIEPVW